jgi:hypothetical protein
MVHVSRYADTHAVPGDGNRASFCLECRCSAIANPTIGAACRLFQSPVQVPPVVVPPSCATLVVCRRGHQRIVDHLRPFPSPADTAQGRGKERLMGRWPPRASASSLAARTSSCLSRRNRTCTAKLLAVHAASGHEAGGDGSFHERQHTPVQPHEVVRCSPPPAA